MALAATNLFAAFDVTAQANELDISPVLEEAIYYDMNLLASLNVDFGNPVDDIIHYFNEEALNADTVVVTASQASTDTVLALSSGHGVHIGDLVYDVALNSTEVIQVTATAATAATIVRAYNSTTAASIANAATLALIRSEQEGSDIGSDRTLNPTVRNNVTHIFSGAYDLQITGSQLARKMATTAYQDAAKKSWLN